MSDQPTNSDALATPGELYDALSPNEQQQCEALENWVCQVQNKESTSALPGGGLIALAADLWSAGQEQAGKTFVSDGEITSVAVAKPEIEGYQIIETIGSGGMGVVYRAVDQKLKRQVAIKVLGSDKVGSERAKKRFRVEVQAAAQLDHPAIVPVFEFGEFPGGLYYTMREISGIDIAEKILRESSDTTQDDQTRSHGTRFQPGSPNYQKWVAGAGKMLANALAHSHEQLVIHRDVKPANILVDHEGTVYLSDFGLARINEGSDLTGDDDWLGTLRYMSPEQTQGSGHSIDGRSDIYALGVTLYEMLTGEPAISETTFASAYRQINEGRIQPPRQLNQRLDRDLETIVMKAISPEPELRYQSADDMADDLDRFLNVLPVQAKPATVGLKVSRWVKRHRRWVTSTAAVIGLLLAITFLVSLYSNYSVRNTTARLLDQYGVEKLLQGDSVRAIADLSAAGQWATSGIDRQRQQLRIAAIESWSPKMVESDELGGILRATHKNGSQLVVQEQDGIRNCFLLTANVERQSILKTKRRVEFATFSNKGDQLAIILGDRSNNNPEVKIYHIGRGTLKTIAQDLEWRITNAWYLPGDQYLATTGWDAAIYLWNTENGDLFKSISFPQFDGIEKIKPWVYAARINSDRDKMFCVVNPGFVVGYSLPDLAPLWEPIRISTWRADATAISPDSKWFVVGKADQGIRMWNFETGDEVDMFNNVRGKPMAARFSPDSRLLAVGDDRGDIFVWNTPNAGEAASIRSGIVMRHEYSIDSIHFNDSGHLLAAAGDSAKVWRLSDNQPLTPLMPNLSPISSVRWQADNTFEVLSVDDHGHVRQTWQLSEYLGEQTSSDGKLMGLVAESVEQSAPEVCIVTREATAETAEPSRKALRHAKQKSDVAIAMPGNTVSFAISGDGQRILIANEKDENNGQIKIYDLKTLESLGPAISMDYTHLAFVRLNNDGTKWMCGGFGATVIVGDTNTGAPTHELRVTNWLKDGRFLDDGQFAAICWDGKLHVWNESGGLNGDSFECSVIPDVMTISEQKIVAAGGRFVFMFEQQPSKQWKQVRTIELDSGSVRFVVINEDQKRLVTCSDNGTTIIWSTSGEKIAQLPIKGPVSNCQFSADGRWLATVGETGQLNVWETKTGRTMGPGISGVTPITLAQWSGNKLLIGGNQENHCWYCKVNLPTEWLEKQ